MGEGGFDSIPVDIKEGGLRDIAPKAYQRADDFSRELKKLYDPKRTFAEQDFGRGNERVKTLIREMTRPSEREEAETSWQMQWITVFNTFYDLGFSKKDGGKGSDEDRFIARAIQTHLIESVEPEVRVQGASAKPKEQKRLLRGTARFALAAAKLDLDFGQDASPQASILEIFERAIFSRRQILSTVEQDLAEPENKQKFSLRNV